MSQSPRKRVPLLRRAQSLRWRTGYAVRRFDRRVRPQRYLKVADVAGPRIEAALPGLRFERYTEPSWPGRTREAFQGWGSVPVQAFGFWDQRPFYFRFRGDSAYLTFWAQGQSFDETEVRLPSGEPEWVASQHDVTGEPYEGFLDAEQSVKTFLALAEALAPVDPETNPTHLMNLLATVNALRAAESLTDGEGATGPETGS